MRKLLICGTASIHVLNYYHLVKDQFDEVMVVMNEDVFPEIKLRAVADYTIKNPFKIPANISKLRNIFQSFKPSVIHAHQCNSVSWYAIKAAATDRTPVIVTAWGDDILLYPSRSYILKRMVKYNLEHAAWLTSDSQYMADKMQELSKRKLSIDVINFGAGEPFPSSVKEKIIYTNRLHKSLYRNDLIIKAFKKFSDTHPDWKLVVAGENVETEKLKELANSLNLSEKVQFPGWLNKEANRANYTKAAIYISIPESDATSVSLLEAMAAGCIPVVSDLPANREWISDNVNGIIVKDLHSDFISAALNLNAQNVRDINASIINDRASAEAAKQKFAGVYNKFVKS